MTGVRASAAFMKAGNLFGEIGGGNTNDVKCSMELLSTGRFEIP